MERVCRPGGCVAIIWPNNLDWLAARGYRHVCFDGPMCIEFSSYEEAVELAGIFFPRAAEEVAPARPAAGSFRGTEDQPAARPCLQSAGPMRRPSENGTVRMAQ